MTKNTTSYNDLLASLVDDLIAKIESGADGSNWSAPWHFDAAHGSLFAPRNYTTGKIYKGGNILMLAAQSLDAGYGRHAWATYKQWQKVDAQVRKGERGTKLVKWIVKEYKDDNGNDKRSMFPSTFTVFNIDQVDIDADAEVPEWDAHQDAETVLAAAPADIRYGGNSAHYVPGADYIQLPERSQFADTEGFYSTAFHELGHWTGAKSRLARDLSGRFGQDAYAVEELIAELTATFVCAQTEVAASPRADHAEYLGHWVSILKETPKVLWSVASAAQKAADMILGFSVDSESVDA